MVTLAPTPILSQREGSKALPVSKGKVRMGWSMPGEVNPPVTDRQGQQARQAKVDPQPRLRIPIIQRTAKNQTIKGQGPAASGLPGLGGG